MTDEKAETTEVVEVTEKAPVRLNLGSGKAERELPGYINIDRHKGQEAFPLQYHDDSVDEIRASHVLEHFSFREVDVVINHWVRVLKPGGILKIAVPNFDYVVKQYIGGNSTEPLEAYIMGAHVDTDDFHKAVFPEEKLRRLMTEAGLIDICEWNSEIKDCASIPASLNLQGRKPLAQGVAYIGQGSSILPPLENVPGTGIKVQAIMSVPRLGFMDNMFCSIEALLPLNIQMQKYTGAFWGQCLERGMEGAVNRGADAVLTIDYDSVYPRDTIKRLVDIFLSHPEADAIAPMEVGRSSGQPLMVVRNDDDDVVAHVDGDFFAGDVSKIASAHFGLTLIRTEALKRMPHPWFCGDPGPDGNWGVGRLDDDISFWEKWRKTGNTLYLANRIIIAQAEIMLMWPGADLHKPLIQHPGEFHERGIPLGVWR